MENELVSVVIPVYNVEKYVEQCLDSVLRQTYRNIEIICVDDASTDNSLAILRKYADLDKRIRIIENVENLGVAFSRNVGFSQVKGKYIYYLDSDDYIELETIEKLYDYAEQYETECIYFNSKILQETEGIGYPRLCFDSKDIEKKVYNGPFFFKILKDYRAYSNSVWRYFWRTDFLVNNDLKFENGLLAEDQVFSLRAILSVKRIMAVNESYHIYRRREGTLSTKENPLKMISIFKNYCILLAFWYSHEFPSDIDMIISNHLNGILITAKRIFFRTQNEVNKECFKEGIERHLFEVLILQEYEKSLNEVDEKVLEKILSFKRVIIFGAGRYAAETVEKLRRKRVKINYLAITHIHKNAVGIGDIPVCEIKDLCCMKDEVIVVLGVGKSMRDEVIDTLSQYGFMNYISLD